MMLLCLTYTELNGLRLAHAPCIPSSSLHHLLQMSQVLNLFSSDPEPLIPQNMKQKRNLMDYFAKPKTCI